MNGLKNVHSTLQVTFTGRGNLVIAPKALLQQWVREIAKICKVGHKTLKLENKTARDRLMRSVAGMKRCGCYARASRCRFAEVTA